MSKIKYRVWDNENKSYDDPYSHSYYAMKQDGGLDFYCHGDLYDNCDQDTYIVEQYTGLKDKNGAEIYEGDIVDKAYHNITTYDKNGVVNMGKLYDSDGYNNGKILGWRAGNSSLLDVCGDCKIIGNIHENPELLGGEE